MFYRIHDSITHVNCAVVPNSDVSGIGVRGGLYLQAAMMILMSCLEQRPLDILLSNLSSQTTSLALISAAYFDPNVDVPHTLVVSHFAILFSTSRISSYDLLPSSLRSRTAFKTSSRLLLLDLFFRTCLVIFNYRIWSVIMELQRDHAICPEGFGQFTFFSAKIDLSVPSLGARSAFGYCIFDVVWEGFRYIAGAARYWVHEAEALEVLKSHVIFDPRYWVIRRLRFYLIPYFGASSTQADVRKPNVCFSRFYFVRKSFVLLYVIVNVEMTISVNGLTSEDFWTFGQIFSMVNMFALVGILIARFMPSMASRSFQRLTRATFTNDTITLAAGLIFILCPCVVLSFYACSKIPFFQKVFDNNQHTNGALFFGYVVFSNVTWISMAIVLSAVIIVVRHLYRAASSAVYSRGLGIIRAFCNSIFHPLSYALFDDKDRSHLITYEVEAIRNVMKSDPIDWQWSERLAKAYESNGDLCAAVKVWEKLGNMFPDSWWPQYQLAEAFENQEELDSAIRVWENLLARVESKDPHRSWWELRLEGACRRKGGQNAVIASWRRLAETHPDRPFFLRCLTNAYEHDGGSKATVKGYKTLVAKCPTKPEYRAELAKAYERMLDMKQAFKQWKYILENHPEYTIAEFQIVSTYLWLIKNGEAANCMCINLRLYQHLSIHNKRFCWRCDDYLHGLPVHVLEMIAKGTTKAIMEGDNEIREDLNRIERLFEESGFA